MAEIGTRQRRWSALAAALVVAAALLLLFGPVLLSDRSLAMRDAAHFYHPLFQWTSERWLEGTPPLWNPYENAGLPLLADGSSSLFYPGRLWLLLPIDFAWRLKLYVVGHAALAALGSYLLARHWRASLPAAAMAAMAYSCGGSVVFQHANVPYLVGAAWLPFALWAIDVLLVARSWRAAVALSAVLALMVLGGDPQMAYHAVLIGVLYAGVLAFRPSPDAPASHWVVRLSRHGALLAAAAAGGFALAAIQILPSLEAAADSERALYRRPRTLYEAGSHLVASGGDRDAWANAARGIAGQPPRGTHQARMYDFSLPPWRLVEVVWPNIGGRMFPTHRRWLRLVPADARIWTPTLYFGLLPLVLALGQWRLRRGDPAAVWMSWLLLTFTIGSFGYYGLGWCAREIYLAMGGDADSIAVGSPFGGLYWLLATFLPGYVSFRYPAKLLVVAALAASQLAARGWDLSVASPAESLSRRLKQLAIASIVVLLGCWAGFSWLNRELKQQTAAGQEIARRLEAQSDQALGPFDLPGAEQDVKLALLQTVIVCLTARMLLRGRAATLSPARQWTLALLVALDIAAANYWLIATAPSDNWRTQPAAAQLLLAEAGRDRDVRIFRGSPIAWRPPSFARLSSADRIAELAAWERDTLFPKYGLNHGISLLNSYSSLKPADYASLLSIGEQFGPRWPNPHGGKLPHPSVLRLLGTTYLVLPADVVPAFPGQPPFAERVHPAKVTLPEDTAIWRLTEPLPRAWVVHDVVQLPALSDRSLRALEDRTREVLFPREKDGGSRRARDFHRAAVVENDLPLDLATNLPAVNSTCRIRKDGLHEVQIETRLDSSGLLVLSDRYASGWQATVETGGQLRRAPILRTNRICRGVWLPAGEHVVRFVYRPPSYQWGSWISMAAGVVLLGCLANALLASPKSRRSR